MFPYYENSDVLVLTCSLLVNINLYAYSTGESLFSAKTDMFSYYENSDVLLLIYV